MSAASDFSMPTNPDDVKRIQNAVLEISAQMQMIADRQENIKEIKKDLKDSFDMPTGLVNKLVKAHFEQKYAEMTEENSVFELVYETIFSDASEDMDDAA